MKGEACALDGIGVTADIGGDMDLKPAARRRGPGRRCDRKYQSSVAT
jgi:hypothetical protein